MYRMSRIKDAEFNQKIIFLLILYILFINVK